jgi:pilus assembly protein Flp/PilA
MMNHKFFGQGIIEYVLLLVFIALVVMVAMRVLGPAFGNVYSQIVDGFGSL